MPTVTFDPRVTGVGALSFSPYNNEKELYPVKTYRPGSAAGRPATPEGFGPFLTTASPYASAPKPGRQGSGKARPSSAPRLATYKTYKSGIDTSGAGPGATTQRVAWNPSQHPAGTHRVDHNTPKYLGRDGRWVQSELPVAVAEANSQPLAATATFEARLPASKGKKIRPVSAVYSYGDISPVVTTEYVRDPITPTEEQLRAYGSSGPYGRPASAGARPGTPGGRPSNLYIPDTPSPRSSLGPSPSLFSPGFSPSPRAAEHVRESHAAAAYAPGPRTSNDTYGHGRDVAATLELARASGSKVDASILNTVGNQWARRLNASNYKLTEGDLRRTQELSLSQHVVPGAHNARLVGGKWRYMPRPVEGHTLFTDFYGPVGGGQDKSAYYGRVYHDVSIY